MGCYGDAAERKKLLSERAHGLNEFMKLPLEDKIILKSDRYEG